MTRPISTLVSCLVLGAALGWLSPAVAQPASNTVPAAATVKRTATQDLSGTVNPERGWFYFEDTKKPEEPEPDAPPPPSILAPKPAQPPKSETCKKPETWKPDCGFVDPGTDFSFQAKQRDALLERMSVAQNDPKAVEAFQYYMRWAIERTVEATNLWWYNMVQNPELDPAVSQPISTVGLRLMTDVKSAKAREIFDLVASEGGFLVYFSRSDCTFCHQMQDTLLRVSQSTGLKVLNASLDEKCMPGFAEGCKTFPATAVPAQALQVTTVPAVFLFVPKNTWIRVATGVVDADSVTTRISQFFTAWRTALLKGVENGDESRVSVDFSNSATSGATTGVQPGGKARMPSEAEISTLLQAAPKQ